MNILRRYGFPRLLMPSSLVLPPVDHCRGTSPSQAANSRPLLKAAPFPMADTTAVETSGPTPGICCKRTQLGSLLAICSKSVFRLSICACKPFHSCQRKCASRTIRPPKCQYDWLSCRDSFEGTRPQQNRGTTLE